MVSESDSKLFLKKEILDQPMKRLNRIREKKYFPPNLFLTEAEMDTEKDIKTLEIEWKESVSKRFEVVPEENIEEIGQASQGEVSKVQIVNSLSQDKRFQNEGNWINLTVFLKGQPPFIRGEIFHSLFQFIKLFRWEVENLTALSNMGWPPKGFYISQI